MYRKLFKRVIDFIAGSVAFIVLLPVLVVCALVLWVACGQAMFVQERVGYKRKKFRVIKFCTMTNERGADGRLLPDEQRLTRVGDFMRRFSLDELPQLLNVIKGDMSLVGPRPLIESQVRNCTNREQRRYQVRPGITGLAQVSGRNSVSFVHRFRYDVWYIDHYSFRVDVMIVYSTVRMMLGIDKNNNVIYDPTTVKL